MFDATAFGEVLFKAAVTSVFVIPTAGLVWMVLHRIQLTDSAIPFRPLDLRSWTLPFTLAMAAAYSVTFAVATNFFSVGPATAIATIMMVLVVPAICTFACR